MSFEPTASTSLHPNPENSNALPHEKLKRVLLVYIYETPAAMDSLGPDAGCYQINKDQAIRIFARSKKIAEETISQEIKNAMIYRISVLESKTNAPDVCGLYFEGLPGNEFTQTGEDHHLFLLGKGHCNTPQDIFVAAGDPELGMQWMREYPQYNADNIRTKEVMRMSDGDYFFVHEKHPVITLLYNNQEQLGTKISPDDKVNRFWYRINANVFEDSCQSLDTQVFSRTPQIFYLTQLRIKLRRPDNKRWVDTPLLHDQLWEAADKKDKREIFKRYMSKPIFVCLRLQIEYAVQPDIGIQSGVAPSLPPS